MQYYSNIRNASEWPESARLKISNSRMGLKLRNLLKQYKPLSISMDRAGALQGALAPGPG
jgi:hypothetical protein